MMQPTQNGANKNSPADAAMLAAYRKQVERLPVTMRPSLNQQLAAWGSLFPFEQRQANVFLRGVESFQPPALETLIQPLKTLEAKMGVEHWNYSQTGDTMENASMLARSQYYAEWRNEVQKIFEAVNAAGRAQITPQAKHPRLVLIVLPESLPVDPPSTWKPWDQRAQMFKIAGDSRRVSELLIQGQADQPGIIELLGHRDAVDASDLWLIDADAQLTSLQPATERESISALSYAALKPFRDRFLAEVNTVPKNIEATDQTLAVMRHRNWEAWWPANLAGQERLRHFVVDLFLSGNGALIFSNAFVEWAASEALRRARPRVIMARFGLRAKPKPFTGIAIFENQEQISALPDVVDREGSAVDALILARYIWLALLRYPEQEHTCGLCISEHQNSAYLVAPEGTTLPWGPEHAATPEELSAWIARYLSA